MISRPVHGNGPVQYHTKRHVKDVMQKRYSGIHTAVPPLAIREKVARLRSGIIGSERNGSNPDLHKCLPMYASLIENHQELLVSLEFCFPPRGRSKTPSSRDVI